MTSKKLSTFDALHFAAGLLKGAWFRTVLFCLAPIALLEVGVIIATRSAASRLMTTGEGFGAQVLPDTRIAVALLGAVLLFMALRTIGATLLWTVALRQVTEGSVRLSTSLFSSYLHWPYTRLMGQDRSRIFENLRTTSRSASQEIVTPLLLLISEVMVAVAITLAVFILAPVATLLLILWFLVVFGLLFGFLSKRSQRLAERKWKTFHKLQELDRWTFSQFRHVRLTAQEGPLTRRHTALTAQAAEIGSRLFLLTTLPRHIGEMALLGAMLILFGWFSFQGHAPSLIIRDIAVLSIASLRLLPAGQRAVYLVHQLQQKLPALRDLFDDFEQPLIELPEPELRKSNAPLFKNILALENTYFGYENGAAVIPRGTSLHVLRGEWLHVSGPSGTGKTTLVSLLLGLLQPTEGAVSIDGHPMDILSALRGGAVAMVPQDAVMVSGTIHENLCFPFASSHIDADHASALLKSVCVERSLDERIGEDGAGLSGGQKLKLAIIRALLLKPELLILDEATSQIDRDGEKTIFELIRTELPNATVVVIAHKLASLEGFHRVWILQNGAWENRATSPQASRNSAIEGLVFGEG